MCPFSILAFFQPTTVDKEPVFLSLNFTSKKATLKSNSFFGGFSKYYTLKYSCLIFVSRLLAIEVTPTCISSGSE